MYSAVINTLPLHLRLAQIGVLFGSQNAIFVKQIYSGASLYIAVVMEPLYKRGVLYIIFRQGQPPKNITTAANGNVLVARSMREL